MVVLGGGAISYERGTPVCTPTEAVCEKGRRVNVKKCSEKGLSPRNIPHNLIIIVKVNHVVIFWLEANSFEKLSMR